MNSNIDREALTESSNPLGLDGIEFIEYTSARPQALGQVLEMMGFQPVARHRSREVLRYRQGSMNVVINAHRVGVANETELAETPTIAAIALRVRDADRAYRRSLDRGAWAVPALVQPMELNIPAIHGVGNSRIYFVDRYRDFSIYDVDFVPIPTVNPNPPAQAGMHWFGLVQYIGLDRMEDWTEFYAEILGFHSLPAEQRFGILPKGRILASPCGSFYLQLIEPEGGLIYMEGEERLQRIGLGVPDIGAAVRLLRTRGIEFMESTGVHTEERGAVTQGYLGGVMFELVRNLQKPDEQAKS
jgi:4-hydroxyphenylpyruvate dioxygenase